MDSPIDGSLCPVQEDYGSIASHFIGNENEKVIYLTFDAGYSNEYTAQILNVLKKNAKAIFFVTYDYCKSVPDQVKQIIADGHVPNHTYSHPSLPECSVKEVAEEIALLHNYVYENFGYEMNLIRPPKGEFSKHTYGSTENGISKHFLVICIQRLGSQ